MPRWRWGLIPSGPSNLVHRDRWHLEGAAGLPFTERHPSVVDADGAVAKAGHNEGAVGVTGQACHAAVSARGDVLGPDTGTWVRPLGVRPLTAAGSPCAATWLCQSPQAGDLLLLLPFLPQGSCQRSEGPTGATWG